MMEIKYYAEYDVRITTLIRSGLGTHFSSLFFCRYIVNGVINGRSWIYIGISSRAISFIHSTYLFELLDARCGRLLFKCFPMPIDICEGTTCWCGRGSSISIGNLIPMTEKTNSKIY